jgi:pyruvate dehydrogenase E2 component (dihydrolipoamide acetyltransferase)
VQAATPAPARPDPVAPPEPAGSALPHASPSVRAFARELGVDLTQVTGSGPKKRILREDVQGFVKSELTKPRGGTGFNLPEAPFIDFSRFGPVEVRPLSKIRKLSGAFLHRNWVSIPHVTQFDEADITGLEAFRKELQAEAQKSGGARLTLLPFLMKATVAALKAYPEFNASLAADGESLVLKQYFHLGFAVDTPNGLVVGVICDVDQKGISALSREIAELSEKARTKGLAPAEMQGGCFTLSSLGGIGGTAFTPILNAPEVGILGISRAAMKPVWDGTTFAPRLMLPLSLSYDHRVIDGAQGARFITHLSQLLADMRRVLL